MKTKQQKPNSRKRHRKRAAKHFLHLLRLIAFTSGLLILLALFHLATFGIPAPLTRKLTAGLQEKGVPLHVRSITFSPHRGWVLHHVSLYSTSADDLRPILQADQMTCQIWPEDWTHLKQTAWDITLGGTDLALSPSYRWDALLPSEATSLKTIRRAHARVTLDRQGIEIHNSEIQWETLLIRAAGRAAFSPATAESTSPPDPQKLEALATRIAPLFDTLSELSFSGPPEFNIQFDFPQGGLDAATLKTTVFIPELKIHGHTYERIGGSVRLQNKMLSAGPARISSSTEGDLTLSAIWDMPRDRIRIGLTNSMPAPELFALLPRQAYDAVTRTGIQTDGPLNFSAEIGPAPADTLLDQLRLNVQSMRATRNDLTLDPLQLTLIRDGDSLALPQIQTVANGSPISGTFSMNLPDKTWTATFQGSVPTPAAANLLGGIPKDWIDRLEFTNAPPDIRGEVSWGGHDGTFQMRADVSGRDGQCAGIPFDTLNTTLIFTNHTFSLAPLRIASPDKNFDGTIHIDLPNFLASFDAETSLEPAEIAQILAPGVPTVLTNFTFNGPVYSKAAGQIDYSGGTNHAASGTILAESVTAANLTATPFSSDVEARGGQLLFTRSKLNTLGGTAEGSAAFDLCLTNHHSPYRLDIDLTGMDLTQIAQHFSTNNFSSTKGSVSASLTLQADASTNFWASATGSGQVKISDGQLADLPIVGGFSRLLRSSLPGFSLFSITTLYAEYDLHDAALYSDNLELGGTLLSAKARGKYSPKDGLDFTLQAEPLRQTRDNKEWYQLHLWMADALKSGTSPLFILLEFKLTGPLKNPQWRLINLPKEITTLLKIPGSILGAGSQKPEPEKEPQRHQQLDAD